MPNLKYKALVMVFAAIGLARSPAHAALEKMTSATAPAANAPLYFIDNSHDAGRLSGSAIARIGRELLTPPAGPAPAITSDQNHIRPLPAVPKAVLMAITGFACVVLTKDRKRWLPVLAGLLWVGQIPIQLVPQSASRFRNSGESRERPGFYFTDGGRTEKPRFTITYHAAVVPTQYVSFPSVKWFVRLTKPFVRFTTASVFQTLCRSPPANATMKVNCSKTPLVFEVGYHHLKNEQKKEGGV